MKKVGSEICHSCWSSLLFTSLMHLKLMHTFQILQKQIFREIPSCKGNCCTFA